MDDNTCKNIHSGLRLYISLFSNCLSSLNLTENYFLADLLQEAMEKNNVTYKKIYYIRIGILWIIRGSVRYGICNAIRFRSLVASKRNGHEDQLDLQNRSYAHEKVSNRIALHCTVLLCFWNFSRTSWLAYDSTLTRSRDDRRVDNRTHWTIVQLVATRTLHKSPTQTFVLSAACQRLQPCKFFGFCVHAG
jgi:hypothetical protein